MDPGPDPGTTLASALVLLVALIIINGFFAAAEMALVSANRTKIQVLEASGNKKATRLLALLEEPTKFLSVIQVAITLAGFLASASAALVMAEDVGQ